MTGLSNLELRHGYVISQCDDIVGHCHRSSFSESHIFGGVNHHICNEPMYRKSSMWKHISPQAGNACLIGQYAQRSPMETSQLPSEPKGAG